MRYAETGFHLEIDLTRGSSERVETDSRLTELHLGGLGTNAKILWDRVPPEVEPFSPDNPLIFGTGLLVGTPAPGANRAIVSSLSPQTLLMAYSMMGDCWGSELKQAGYDKLVIRGKSPDWVYLWINNDKVEIRDASHLLGKSTFETMELVQKELKDSQAQVACIGLAGENKVYFASIEAGKGSASRQGLGAVMGDKKIKAIAVRGTKDINIARPSEFFELCNEVLKNIQQRINNPLKNVSPSLYSILGSPNLKHVQAWHLSNFAWGNARRRRSDSWKQELEDQWVEVMNKEIKRFIGCYNCPLKCGAIIEPPGGPTFLMKCWSKIGWLMGAKSEDLDLSFRLASRGIHYGVDAFTAPQVIAFALELQEAGILTDKELAGMPSDVKGSFFWLLDRIVRREGVGDVLANGTYWAARQIKGAEAYDHNTVKKHEQVAIKLGMLNPLYFLMIATGEKMTITQFEGQVPQQPFPTKEAREEFVKDWIQIPTGMEERVKKFILEWGDGENKHPFYPSIDLICEIVDWQETMHHLDDTTGVCSGLSAFQYKTPYHIHNFPLFISYATGMDIDEGEQQKIVRRNRNLIRAVNIRRGVRRKDDRPPEDHWKKRFPEYEAKLLDEYYKFKGWNKDGIPTKETLQKLGLDYVYEDLAKREILTEE